MVKKKRPPFTQLGGVNKAVLGLQGLTSNRRALGGNRARNFEWCSPPDADPKVIGTNQIKMMTKLIPIGDLINTAS